MALNARLKLSDIIAFFALIVAIVGCIYSVVQAGIADKSYEASVAQLNLAKKAQDTAEDNYRVALQQLELQRRTVAAEANYRVTIGHDTDANLQRDLVSGQDIAFSLQNGSKLPLSYKVIVRSEGMGVFWQNQMPNKLFFQLPMDQRPILLQPLETYKNVFSIWFPQASLPNAKLQIYVNDELAVEYRYIFDQKNHVYKFSPA
jgi:hypothetical protein